MLIGDTTNAVFWIRATSSPINFHFGVSKRKAETSLDEWLEEGTLYAEAMQVRQAAIPVEEVLEPLPTVVKASATEETPSVPTVSAEVTGQDSTEWFWALLEQARYERW